MELRYVFIHGNSGDVAQLALLNTTGVPRLFSMCIYPLSTVQYRIATKDGLSAAILSNAKQQHRCAD